MSGDHDSRPCPLDGCHYAKTWKVVAGDIGHKPRRNEPEPEYFAIIDLVHEVGGDVFKLSSRKVHNGITETVFRQNLRYNPSTGALDSLQDDWPQRCISFWERQASRGAEKDCIFAMRRMDPSHAGGENDRLHWENADPNGSWGAEGG